MNKGDHPPMRTRPFISLYAVLLLGAFMYAQKTGTPQPTPTAPQPTPTAPQAAPKPPRPARIVTRTRLASIFSGIENQLFDDLQKKDQTALIQLVTDDFAIWMPTD